MQDVIIVCAGSYGKEVYSEINEINARARRLNQTEPYRIIGFINDLPDALVGTGIDLPILGGIKDWKPIGDEVYALGLGTPESKKKVATMLKSRGCRFISVISVFAHVAKNAEIGEGCLITSATVGGGAKIGKFVNINGSMIYSGAEIGDYSTTTGFTVIEEAKLGSAVHVGTKAVVTKGCKVGDGARISAGSVVMEDVRPGVVVFGMPAQEIG